MVKLLCFVKRKEGLSADEFRRHWHEKHGPLIAGLPNLARHIVRYEQHPKLHGDSGVGSGGYDGVAVQWFESLDAFNAFVSEPDYAAHVFPDEDEFLDRESLVWMIAEEPKVVIDGPTSS